jgi:hypothetical protein
MRRTLPLALAVALALAAIAAAAAWAQHSHTITRHEHDASVTFPFKPSPSQRHTTSRDGLVPWWDDGRACSVGCRARGVIPGWPLKPFHHQHALRDPIDARRDSTFHVGIDIQASKNDRVYAIQPGTVHVIESSGAEERVQVGNFIYWHIKHRVHEGQRVKPYRTVLGLIKAGFGHLHLSEVDAGNRYLDPLRPGGRAVAPWRDTSPPVIGKPRFAGGRVYVQAFDRQSYIEQTTYITPVLSLAGLAYRVFDSHGHAVGPLEWAFRGTQVLPFSLDRSIWASDAHRPGFSCFALREVCKPKWDYVLAGGLAPGLSRSTLDGCGCRLSIYAWDYASNSVARDFRFGRGHGSGAPRAPRVLPKATVPPAPPRARSTDRD